jgi:hypothetical protein
LATYNDFLQPSRFEVRSALTGLADLDVQWCIAHGRIAYQQGCSPSNDLSTKDGKDELVQEAEALLELYERSNVREYKFGQ